MFLLPYELKFKVNVCVYSSFPLLSGKSSSIFVLVRLDSADLRGNTQGLNFTNKHTPEDEHDGNGEILYKTPTK